MAAAAGGASAFAIFNLVLMDAAMQIASKYGPELAPLVNAVSSQGVTAIYKVLGN